MYYEPDHLAVGRLRLFIEPGVLPYYACSFEKHGDGPYAATIVVERRTWTSYLWPPTMLALLVEEGKLFIRRHIVKYGSGGLTDKIELKVVDDESSDERYLSVDVPSPARYRRPAWKESLPPTSRRVNRLTHTSMSLPRRRYRRPAWKECPPPTSRRVNPSPYPSPARPRTVVRLDQHA